MNKMVSVIIPIYNEKDSIAHTVNEICACMDKNALSFELLLIDDGSSDGTREIIDNISSTHVKKIMHPLNKGYGAALKTGIRASNSDVVVITDADGTYPIEIIPALVKEISNYEMVVGARTGQNVSIPYLRKPAKWFIGRLANYLSGTKIPDINSGLRVMKKNIVERFIHLLPDGFSFTSTITLALLTNGYTIKYLPINYFRRKGKSKIKPIRDTFNFIQLIIRMVLYFNPLKVFVPLSLLLAIFAFIILFGSWLLTGRAMDVTFGVFLMTAVMVLAIGMLADLIDKRIQ